MGSEPSLHGAAATRTPQPWPKVLSLWSCCHLTWWHKGNTKPQACGCSLIHHSMLPGYTHLLQSRKPFLWRFSCSQALQLPINLCTHLHWSFHIARPHSGGITPCLSSRSQGLLPWNLYKPAPDRTQLPRTAQLWVSDLPVSRTEGQFILFACNKEKN